ncbi:MAG TPA: hypothetical protein ENG66_01680 [Thermococcus sp.]|nr:hypothetical protein [Thermococcus sp.]
MCLSLYDLLCDKCRKKCDEIFKKEPETIEEEAELREKLFRQLCKRCRRQLIEEGFINAENEL